MLKQLKCITTAISTIFLACRLSRPIYIVVSNMKGTRRQEKIKIQQASYELKDVLIQYMPNYMDELHVF